MTCEADSVVVLVVPIEQYRRALGLLSRHLHKSYKVAFSYRKAFFPLKPDTDASDIKLLMDKLGAEKICVKKGILPRRVRSTKISVLERKFGINLPKSVNCVGDILLINTIPKESESRKSEVGDILRRNFGVRAVFLKSHAISGETRIAKWERISGWGDTFTLHSENGCIYALDVSKVFFNPRLGAERLRVANEVNKNEIVIDMFAGVGSFSILISKLKRARVFAIDINPNAVEFMRINSILNSVDITVLEGDAREVIYYIPVNANRIIMNYPERSVEFIPSAIAKLKKVGMIHLYLFVKSGDPLDIGKRTVVSVMSELNIVVKKLRARIVGEVAPFKYLVCVDVMLSKKPNG